MAYWLSIAFGLAFLFAVIPVGSIELFMLGLIAHRHDIPWLALGAAVATGQVLGKLVHFYAARGALRLPVFVRVKTSAVPDRPSRLATIIAVATERARAHPVWRHAVFSVSALIGLPPFGAATLVAGLVGMRTAVYLAVGLTARVVRYSFLAAAPSLVADLLY